VKEMDNFCDEGTGYKDIIDMIGIWYGFISVKQGFFGMHIKIFLIKRQLLKIRC
jgi:hypothetical protein